MLAQTIAQFCQTNRESILAQGQPWSRYLLMAPDDARRIEVKKQLLRHPAILTIVEKLNENRFYLNDFHRQWTDYRVYGSFYWLLRFLADIGISASEAGIVPFVKRLMLQQFEDGQFIVGYHRNKQQTIRLICLTAHLTYCLIRLGYENSATVQTALNYIVTTQRDDGSWHCDRLKQRGERNQSAPGCPAATIHIVRALGQFGARYKTLLRSALDQLFDLIQQDSLRGCELDSPQNLNFDKLRYPPHYTGLDILNVIHSLSFIPGIDSHPVLNSLVASVLDRWDGKNWLPLEKRLPAQAMFNRDRTSRYSDWLTSYFIQAIDNIYLNRG